MALKRPIQILAHNAKQMLAQGATDAEIDAYLADNGASAEQVLSAPAATPEVLARIAENEKSGKWAEQQAQFEQAGERAAGGRRNIERLETAQGVARGFGQGLTYGFADELESALTGQDVNQIRQEQKEFEQEHPVMAIGSTVGGAIAGSVAAPIVSLGKAAPGASFVTREGLKALGVNVAKGAGEGLIGGALYGLGSGEGGVSNRLENAAQMGILSGALGAAMPAAVAGVKDIGRGVSSLTAEVTGLTSGAGGESVKQAYSAGQRGSETFKEAMRGQSDAFQAVEIAEDALKHMERVRGQEFARALPKDGNFLLPQDAIAKALDEAGPKISGVRAGVDDVAANAYARAQRVFENVAKEGGLTFNNAMEAKQAMDAIIQPLQRAGEKNAVRIIQPIQNALKTTMTDAVPEYGTALADFAKSSRLIDSIRSAISGGKNPTTELRALQSLTRQSVTGAQGGKIQLGRALDKVAGGKLLDAIAGGQVSQWTPRDIMRGAAGIGAAMQFNPLGVAGAAVTSPRLVGESAYKLGQLSRVLSKLPRVRVPAYGLGAALEMAE